jgi:hypothetical protein
MKIRSGFISNSSSCSFTVDAKSSMEVYKKMIPLLKKNYCMYDDDDMWEKYHARHVKTFEETHDDDFNGGIIIPFTCNFETYIFPVKNGKCYVETCNNHPWEEVFSGKDNYLEDDINDYRKCENTKTICVNVSTNKTTTPSVFYHKK